MSSVQDDAYGISLLWIRRHLCSTNDRNYVKLWLKGLDEQVTENGLFRWFATKKITPFFIAIHKDKITNKSWKRAYTYVHKDDVDAVLSWSGVQTIKCVPITIKKAERGKSKNKDKN